MSLHSNLILYTLASLLVFAGVLVTWLARRLSRLNAAFTLFEAERLTSRGLGERLEHQVEGWQEMLEAKNEDLAASLIALQDAQEKLVLNEKMASLGTLSAGVAHEINNPLAFVSSNLSFVREQLEGVLAFTRGPSESGPAFHSTPDEMEELRRALDEGLEGSRRIAAIVSDLKTFCRTDETRVAPVDVVQALESALRMAHLMVQQRARVVRELAVVPTIDAHPGRVAQVFLNLLVNAALAIPEGDVSRNEIRIRVYPDTRGGVVTEIHDTGVGIPAEIHGRIFEPFFTTRPVGQGNGLGLSVSRNIVHSFGGTVTFESTLGQGSRFRVVLPASRPQEGVNPADDAVPVLPAAFTHSRSKTPV